MKNAKVILVEGNAIFQNVLKSFIENETCCEIIAVTQNSESCLQMKNIDEANIVFLDIDFDLEACKAFESALDLLTKYPHLKLIAISSYNTKLLKELLLDVGFKGFVLKSSFYKDIVPVLEHVLYKDTVIQILKA